MKIKKLLSIVLAVIMVLGVCPVMNAFAAEERKAIDSGICGAQGDNLKWTLFDDGELVISGEGEMDWYFPLDGKVTAPWNDYYDKIKVITIEEGVKSIGMYAFRVPQYAYQDKHVAVFHKINLPLSLEFYEGNFFRDSSIYRPTGSHLAICYAGDEEAWSKVQQKKFKVEYNNDTGKAEREFIEVSAHHEEILSNPSDGFKKLYFNGEEPAPFCEIPGDKGLTDLGYGAVRHFYAHYYIGDLENAELKWDIEGDSGRLKTYTNEDGLKYLAELRMFTHGKAEVTLRLESAEGMMISSDTSEPIVSANSSLNIFELIFVYVGGFFSEIFFLFSYGFVMLGALIGSIFS